jgi:rubrerythrin
VSILFHLNKIVDPMTARIQEAERKRLREQSQREADGDPPRFRCRVCGLEGPARGYCPDCLADTMEPLTPGPPDALR